jgi:outer membrane immunogenic protein
MNRRILLLVVIFCSIFFTSAQAQFRMGPTGGLNFHRQVFKSNTYKYDAVFRSRLAFHLGIITDVVIDDNFSLQSELIYTQRGGYYKTDMPDITEEFQSDLGYLSLPVCLTAKLDVKSAYLFIGAGPYLSKLINSSHRFSANDINYENGKLRVGTNTETDQIKPWDAGVKVKAGFELKKGMYMCAFYDISTSDINPQFTVVRNKTFGIQLAYIFSLTEEDRYNRFESFYEF